MIFMHLVIDSIILVALYKHVFGEYKGTSGKMRLITKRVESSRLTHRSHIGKSHKSILIIHVSIKMLFMLLFFIGSSVYRYVFVPDGYAFLSLNRQNWSPIPLLILLIVLSGLLVYPLRSKPYLARRFLTKNKRGISINTDDVVRIAKDVNTMVVMAFYVLLFVYPVYIVSLNQYAYFNEDEIIIRDAFAFEDRFIDYRDIERVERTFGSGPLSDRITSMHYVIYDQDGYKINILFPIETDQTLYIHRILRQERPELFEPHVMTAEEIAFIETKTTKIERQILQIFD
jgi:hypothetical protein